MSKGGCIHFTTDGARAYKRANKLQHFSLDLRVQCHLPSNINATNAVPFGGSAQREAYIIITGFCVGNGVPALAAMGVYLYFS